MKSINFSTTTKPRSVRLRSLLNADPKHPHIHLVDMPFRSTSIWQEHGCEIGIWQNAFGPLAWALFQPSWWNLDYGLLPSARGSTLEKAVFRWGAEQMRSYARRSGEQFWGSIEFFEDAPDSEQTKAHLKGLGFKKFDWSTDRFEMELGIELAQPQIPEGFAIRPLRGASEVESYVRLHRAAFGSENMTTAWRHRTLEHQAYRPELDLVVVNHQDQPVGFCICWMWGDMGQIEPLGVHPDYQGQGLGRALELYGLKALQRQGARSVYVDHVSLNEKAVTLSLKTGFKKINSALRYYIELNCET